MYQLQPQSSENLYPAQEGLIPTQPTPGQEGLIPTQPIPGQGGFIPTQGGAMPGQGGFNPAQGGAMPGQGGFNPNQGGAMPGQGGFIPAQGGAMPGQGGFIPNQGGPMPGQPIIPLTAPYTNQKIVINAVVNQEQPLPPYQPPPNLKTSPVFMTCPNCRNNITTVVETNFNFLNCLFCFCFTSALSIPQWGRQAYSE